MSLFNKIKNAIKSITWPTKKALFADTAFIVCFVVVISLMIFGLSFAADKLIAYFLF